MSRLSQRFDRLRQANKRAFVTFITAGDPEPDLTVPLLHHLVDTGADILELGVPFSDPMADGPVIQKANERALVHEVGLERVLQMVQEFRQQDRDTPVVLMGYLNPLEHMGLEPFAAQAAEAGVDGVITVDLPPEEAVEALQIFDTHHISPIFLLAPTSTDQRIERACAQSRGFVYYVSLRGVTGAQLSNYHEIAAQVARIRSHTSLPVGVGFGISDQATATAIGQYADAIVVGSALVSCIEKHTHDPHAMMQQIKVVMTEIRGALDALPPLKRS